MFYIFYDNLKFRKTQRNLVRIFQRFAWKKKISYGFSGSCAKIIAKNISTQPQISLAVRV